MGIGDEMDALGDLLLNHESSRISDNRSNHPVEKAIVDQL